MCMIIFFIIEYLTVVIFLVAFHEITSSVFTKIDFTLNMLKKSNIHHAFNGGCKSKMRAISSYWETKLFARLELVLR